MGREIARKRAETTTASVSDRGYLRLALPAIAGAAAAYVLWRFAVETSTAPPRIVLAAVPVYLVLWLATVLLHARRSQLVLARLGSEVPLGLLARLWLAGRAVGSLVPSATLGGEPLRAQLLVAHGIPATRAAGAVALDRSIELAGNMIVGLVIVATVVALGVGSGWALWTTAGVAISGLAFLTAVYVRGVQGRPALVPILAPPLRLVPVRWRERLRGHTIRADHAMREMLAAHPRLVPIGLALSLAIEALHLVEFTALYAVFAIALPFRFLLLTSLGMGVAHGIPVTAALGTLEATQIGILTVGGEPLATGLAVAVALRVGETLAIVAGLICLATARTKREPS